MSSRFHRCASSLELSQGDLAVVPGKLEGETKLDKTRVQSGQRRGSKS